MKAEQILDLMRTFVDDNGLLVKYRNDLEVHDRATLEQLQNWKALVWIVGETFSYLNPVGFHAHENAWIEALARPTGRGYEPGARCLIIRPSNKDPLTETTVAQALELTRSMRCMTVKDGFIINQATGAAIGELDICYGVQSGASQPIAYTTYRPYLGQSDRLSQSEAMRLALCEAMADRGSDWYRVVDVTPESTGELSMAS